MILRLLGGWSACTASVLLWALWWCRPWSSQGRELNSQRWWRCCSPSPFPGLCREGVVDPTLLLPPHSLGLWAQLPSREMESPSTIPAFPPFCLLCEFKSTHLQIHRCVNLSGFLVGWAEEPLLNYGSPNSCILKGRDKGSISSCHDASNFEMSSHFCFWFLIAGSMKISGGIHQQQSPHPPTYSSWWSLFLSFSFVSISENRFWLSNKLFYLSWLVKFIVSLR